jgi:copper(I)-binding protein
MNAPALLAGLLALSSASAAVAAPPAAHGVSAASAPAARACMPVAEAAWIRAAPPSARMLAGYVRLRNPCKAAIVLTGARSVAFGSVMLHETRIEGGVSRMRHAAALTIAPGRTLALAPGGAHLMLMQPARVPAAGERVRIELALADGRRLPVQFTVRADAPD